jgi:single-strand DNA-binding protein
MRSVNKVILVGYVAADPEAFGGGTGMRVTFPLATHRDFTSGGAKQEVTDYHRVVCWGKLGDICMAYLTKGRGVYVEGRIINRAFEKDGTRRYVTEIRADEVNMLTWNAKDGVEKVTLNSTEPDEASIAA